MNEQLERYRPKYLRDPQLRGLLDQNAQALGEMSLNRFIRAQERFNGPVHVHQKDGSVVKDNNWHLKQVLEEVPGYVEASERVGLDPVQAEELLLGLLNATPHDFERNEVNILLLRKALDQQAGSGQRLAKRDLTRIHKMIALAGKEGVIPRSLHGYTTARRIGMSVKDSADMIMHLSDADGALAGYTFGPFNEALSTLAIAEVDPNLVKDTFAKLGGKRPYYRQGAYRLFEEAVTFAGPSNGMSPQEIMTAYFVHASEGEDITDFIARMFGEDQKSLEADSSKFQIIHPGQEKDKRFITKPGALEHAALSYRTSRALNDGVRDLEQMVVAKGHRWEQQAEGYWVFDPNSDVWFSLGGKTEVAMGRVRHNFITSDISQLSRNPFLFHIHPEGLEVMLTDPYSDFPSREYRDHVTKFLSSTPSRADYGVVAQQIKDATHPVQPRSFIAHSLGVTEFTYPSDLTALERMAVESRDIKDKALLDYRWNEIMRRWYRTDEATVVRELINDLNEKLPTGFRVNLYPTGTDMKQIAK